MGARPRHKPGKVRHVDEVECTNLVRNLPHAGEVNNPRISAAPADNQLRSFLLREFFQFVIVDRLGFFW